MGPYTAEIKNTINQFETPLDSLAELDNRLEENHVWENATEKEKLSIEEQSMVVSYLTLASAVIESYSSLVLQRELFKSEYLQDDYVKNEVERKWSQGKREHFLHSIGIIGNSTKEDMEAVRAVRNAVVHEPHARKIPDEHAKVNIKEISNKVDEIIDELLSHGLEQIREAARIYKY